MIISNNRKPSLEEFSQLVFSATDYLNRDAAQREKYYATRTAQRLEDDVTMTVRLWRTLSPAEKHRLMVAGYAYFPGVLGHSSTKYDGFSLWLASHWGIVSTSMRDVFSAGGQRSIATGQEVFERKPQSFHKVFLYRSEIVQCIAAADEAVLKENWNVPHIQQDRIGQWIDLVASGEKSKKDAHNTQYLLNQIFDTHLS